MAEEESGRRKAAAPGSLAGEPGAAGDGTVTDGNRNHAHHSTIGPDSQSLLTEAERNFYAAAWAHTGHTGPVSADFLARQLCLSEIAGWYERPAGVALTLRGSPPPCFIVAILRTGDTEVFDMCSRRTRAPRELAAAVMELLNERGLLP